MPHITKGGKFVFGWCKVRENGTVRLPNQAIEEYNIETDSPVICFSGSKTSAGFGITNKTMLAYSPLKKVLENLPELTDFSVKEGQLIRCKGRFYCWTTIKKNNTIRLSKECLTAFSSPAGSSLLAIRSSNIAFICIVKGPIIERARKHPELPEF